MSLVQTAPPAFLIGKCLRDTRDLIFRHFRFLIGLFLIWGLPFGALSAAKGWGEHFTRANELLLLPWTVSFLWGIQQRESGYQAGLLRSAWQGICLLPRLVGYLLMSGLALLCSAICLILPAVYVWVSLSVGAALAIGYGHTVEDVMSRSFELTKQHFWKLLFFWMVFGAFTGFLMIGSLSVPQTLEFAGFAGPSTLHGWPTAVWEFCVQAQLMALGHIAGLAILKQLLSRGEPEDASGETGLNPVGVAE